jgi:hypothetical protein
MKYYNLQIGSDKMTIKAMNLKEAKNMAQWLKFKYSYSGLTNVKLIKNYYERTFKH